MLKSRKSLDNGIVYVVLRTENQNKKTSCIGVFSTMREAKCHVMSQSLKTININHYNPSMRFIGHKEVYSLSKDAPIYWEDMWNSSGIHEYFIQLWHVDTEKHDVLYCVLDVHIKNQIVSNVLSWTKVQELLVNWCSMSNYELFYDTCFADKPLSWLDNVDKEKWITKYEEKEFVNTAKPKVLSRHMSMMKHISHT